MQRAMWPLFGAFIILSVVIAAITLTESRIPYHDMPLFLICSGTATVAVAGVIGATMIMLAAANRSKVTAEKSLEQWESGTTQQYDSAGSV